MKSADDPWAALASSGQLRSLASPSWVRAQLSTQIQRVGAALEVSPPEEKQPRELEPPPLAGMEPEP